MDIDRTWLVGGAGLLVGGLIGFAIGGDGREAREAEMRRQDALAANVTATSEAVGKIDRTLTDLGARVASLETAVAEGARQQAGRAEGLEKRLEQVGESLDGAVRDIGGAVSALGSDVTSRLAAPLEGLRAAMDSIGGRADGRRAETVPGAPAGAGEAVAIGHTVAFGDGAAQLFLSGVDPAAGTARVAINGPVATTVSLDEPVEAGACTLTLTGFSDEGATFTGECGGAQAAAPAEGAGAEAAAAAPAEGTGAGTAVAVGAAETLVEGKLRVFLSGIDAAAGTARVAVNGPETTVLSIGQPIQAGGCRVTLTGIAEGQATIDGSC
jgi:hypothetical protein